MSALLTALGTGLGIAGLLVLSLSTDLRAANKRISELETQLTVRALELEGCDERAQTLKKDKARDATTRDIPDLDLPLHVRGGWMLPQ